MILPNDLCLSLVMPAWTVVFTINKHCFLEKGRHGMYEAIVEAAGRVRYRFGCYSWGGRERIDYCGSFAQDYAHGSFKSNLHARVHNYLQNHRIKENGQKNTNLMVFEQINQTLVQEDVQLRIFTFETLRFSDQVMDFAQYSNDPDLVHTVEQLLITWYRKQGQCIWNRT